ncbi:MULTISPECIES: YciI family protein [unclassified Bradyrhizobium]|uniref:YciI family protein n=1 Tax=unclassified Bradyrhizobium TaxID=2631580 RepID=UPI0028F0E59A|nr:MULTISPECIES: YciI family protein [unclassified Bradyrhizobium]
MLFAIHALDKPGALPDRLANYDAHRAYLESDGLPVTIVMSGPLVSDDGATMIGSLFLVEAPGRAEAEAFNRNDPFAAAGIWEKVTVTGFFRRKG